MHVSSRSQLEGKLYKYIQQSGEEYNSIQILERKVWSVKQRSIGPGIYQDIPNNGMIHVLTS